MTFVYLYIFIAFLWLAALASVSFSISTLLLDDRPEICEISSYLSAAGDSCSVALFTLAITISGDISAFILFILLFFLDIGGAVTKVICYSIQNTSNINRFLKIFIFLSFSVDIAFAIVSIFSAIKIIIAITQPPLASTNPSFGVL